MFFGFLPENTPISAAFVVVPQMQQNKRWALAPAVYIRLEIRSLQSPPPALVQAYVPRQFRLYVHILRCNISYYVYSAHHQFSH
jgi:hypothetical protein